MSGGADEATSKSVASGDWNPEMREFLDKHGGIPSADFTFLAEHLGPTLTAFLGAARNAHGSDADPARLQAAREVWEMLAVAHHPHTARSWLIAANPHLSGDAPVERLRAGHIKVVISTARAFVSGEVQGS